MSQLFSENRRTKKNLKTPKEIIWENQEKDNNTSNIIFLILFKLVWLILMGIRLIAIPFFDFKIGVLYSKKIGRFLGNTEFYLRKISLEKNKKKFHIILSGKSINHQVLTMISRKVFLIRNQVLYNFFNKIKKISLDSDIWIDLNITGWLRGNDWTGATPQLKFTDEEIKKGEHLLLEIGLKKDSKFVCIFAKDKLYSDDPEEPPELDTFWYKKDFRNCDINNYLLAAEYLTKKNIYVLRMGLHKPEKKLISNNEKIIDYSNDIRPFLKDPEFADVFLSAKCKFFIGCTSGTYNFASIFNTPVAYTNMIPYGECGRNFHDIVIFKKCENRNTKKVLSIQECIKKGITGDWLTENKILELENDNIFFKENSSDEILDLTIEMNDRLNNDWSSQKDEEILQKKFLEITSIYSSDGSVFPGKVGYNFLKKNTPLIN